MSTLATTNIKHPSSASNNIVLDSSGGVDLDALTVSGSAPADSVNIDASGRLLVGTSTARANIDGYAPTFQVEGNNTSEAYISCIKNGNASRLFLGRSNGNSVGSNTAIPAADYDLGFIHFVGNNGTNFKVAASITAYSSQAYTGSVNGGYLTFSTTADGASTPTENMRIRSDGAIYTGLSALSPYNNTTAQAANGFITTTGYLARSTSSIKYKTNVETLENQYADAVLDCRPVYYRSLCNEDNASWGWWGFIAEEVAQIDSRLVHWKTVERVVDENGQAKDVPLETPEPEGVQYDRFVPHLLNLVKRQKEQIEAMEARLSALEAS